MNALAGQLYKARERERERQTRHIDGEKNVISVCLRSQNSKSAIDKCQGDCKGLGEISIH